MYELETIDMEIRFIDTNDNVIKEKITAINGTWRWIQGTNSIKENNINKIIEYIKEIHENSYCE